MLICIYSASSLIRQCWESFFIIMAGLTKNRIFKQFTSFILCNAYNKTHTKFSVNLIYFQRTKQLKQTKNKQNKTLIKFEINLTKTNHTVINLIYIGTLAEKGSCLTGSCLIVLLFGFLPYLLKYCQKKSENLVLFFLLT